MVCSNCQTINPTMLTQEAGQSSRDCPLQVLTGTDHKPWLKMFHSLTQASHRLLHPLGRYIGAPHRPDVWFLCEMLGSFCLKVDLGAHDVYILNQTLRSTRYGTTYIYSHCNTAPCWESRCATITNWLGRTIKLHSSSPTWSPLHICSPNQLLATQASWENQSLWKHLRINDGAGDWIFSGLMHGSLVIGHDGSYMPHLANNVCACATVVYSSHTNQYADITWVKKSTKKAANNYHAEILGACSTQLIIKVAITGRKILGHGPLTVGCNNMGVLQHGNSPQRQILEKQPQSDVLRYFKGFMALSRIGGRMQHVYSHADEYLLEIEMSPAQRVSCRADKLATVALMATEEANEFISRIFPLEKVCVEIAGERVTGSPPKCNHRALGRTGGASTV
jgi:hypothetical protein